MIGYFRRHPEVPIACGFIASFWVGNDLTRRRWGFFYPELALAFVLLCVAIYVTIPREEP